MEKCPIDIENAHYDELLHFALYGKPGVLKDDDPVLLTFMNQRLPLDKQIPVPEVETDDPVILDLLGKKKLEEPPMVVEKPPKKLEEEAERKEVPVYRRPYILNFDWSCVKGEFRALDYDKYLEIDENHPTPRMCRLLTMVCFKLLFYLEQHLLELLKNCQSDIIAVREKIRELKSSGNDSPQKRWWVNVYGIPYFKDKHHFPCPSNEDVHRKKCNKEMVDSHLCICTEWTAADQSKLETAVKNQEIKNRIDQAEREKIKLLKSLELVQGDNKRTELQQQLRECLTKDFINKMTLKDLCEDKTCEYDWLRISAKDFDGYKDPEECEIMWKKYLHPRINRRAWTTAENEKLKELAIEFSFQNWEAITEKLGTQRASFQVMQHYQKNLNENFINKKWSEEENERLVNVIARCKVGSRISWRQVTDQMQGHTKQQIFKHWTYYVNPELKRGRFTQKEDMLLVAAVRSYGEDFPRLMEFFPYRSCDQLRTRYKMLLKCQPNTWKNPEDQKLLDLVEQHGKRKWKDISEYFSNRSAMEVKEHYKALKQNMDTNMKSNSDTSAAHEELGEQTCEENKLWRKVQEILPNVKESNKMDRHNLKQLKEILCKGEIVPNSKSERGMSAFDKECYSYFKCISEPNFVAESELYERKNTLGNSQALKCILHLLHARLAMPKNVGVLGNHHLLDKIDTYTLRQLAKESFITSEISASQRKEKKFSFPPNYTTLAGFCSLLLHRPYLLDVEKAENIDVVQKATVKHADHLLKQRLFSLFLWPALVSAEPPNISECLSVEDSGTKNKHNIIFQTKRKVAREEELKFISKPKRAKYVKSVKYSVKDEPTETVKCSFDVAQDIPKKSSILLETKPTTSCSVGNVNEVTVVEIVDEGIYKKLLSSADHKNEDTSEVNIPFSLTGNDTDFSKSTSFILPLENCSETVEENELSFNVKNCRKTYSRTRKQNKNSEWVL